MGEAYGLCLYKKRFREISLGCFLFIRRDFGLTYGFRGMQLKASVNQKFYIN